MTIEAERNKVVSNILQNATGNFSELVQKRILEAASIYKPYISTDNLIALAKRNLTNAQLNQFAKFDKLQSNQRAQNQFFQAILNNKDVQDLDGFDQQTIMQLIKNANTLDHFTKIFNALSSRKDIALDKDSLIKLADKATTIEHFNTILELQGKNTRLTELERTAIIDKIVKNSKFNIEDAKLTPDNKRVLAKFTSDPKKLDKLAGTLENSNIKENLELARAIINNSNKKINRSIAEKILKNNEIVQELTAKELKTLAEFAYSAEQFKNILAAPKVDAAIVDIIVAKANSGKAGISLSREPTPCSLEDIGESILNLHNNQDSSFSIKQLSTDNIIKLQGSKYFSDHDRQSLILAEYNAKVGPKRPPEKAATPIPAAKTDPVPAPPVESPKAEVPPVAKAIQPPKAAKTQPPKTQVELTKEWLAKEKIKETEVTPKENGGFIFSEKTEAERRAEIFVKCLQKMADETQSGDKDEEGKFTLYANDFDVQTVEAILTQLPRIPGLELQFPNVKGELSDALKQAIEQYNQDNLEPLPSLSRLPGLLDRMEDSFASTSTTASEFRLESVIQYFCEINRLQIRNIDADEDEDRFHLFNIDKDGVEKYLFSVDPETKLPYLPENLRARDGAPDQQQALQCLNYLQLILPEGHVISATVLEEKLGKSMVDLMLKEQAAPQGIQIIYKERESAAHDAATPKRPKAPPPGSKRNTPHG